MKDARKIKDLLYEQVARIGKVFSSPKRLELIELLCQGEMTVETLASEASISMKLASAHLRELRGAHLVETERRGKNIFYRLVNKEVADFCENTFGVKFPMFVKSAVTGKTANPLFRQLADKTGQRPRWNFHKYVVARDGQRVTSFNTATDPKDPAFLKDIEEKLLGK